MKRWITVRIKSHDEHDSAFRWAESVQVFATEADCVAVAFRQVNRPSKNVNVRYAVD